jgi:hypothetical protein
MAARFGGANIGAVLRSPCAGAQSLPLVLVLVLVCS